MTAKRVGIYARISQKDKKVPKVENQIAICRAIAADEGWNIDDAHIYVDDGIAASGSAIDDTTLKNRPGALACIAAIRAAKFDILIAVEGERLARTYFDGLEWIAASAEGGVRWHLDTDGFIDPASPAGEETAVSIFASGRREGRVRQARQRRAYDRLLAEGMPLWNVRAFGYEDRTRIRESEAIHIRKAVTDYLEGRKSLTAIAHHWNDLGLKTDGMKRPRRRRGDSPGSEPQMPRGHWTTTTVQQLLLRERNAGILMNNGAELPNSQIEPIISRDELEQLRNRVKVGTPVGARASSLLGGIIRCVCDAPMHSTTSYSQRKGGKRYEYRHYKCSQVLYDKTRQHASIVAGTTDAAAIREIGLLIASSGLEETPDNTSARLGEILARLAELTDQERRAEDALFEGLGDSRRWKGRLQGINAERLELTAEREQLESVNAGADVLAAVRRFVTAEIAIARQVHPSRAGSIPWADVNQALKSLAAHREDWAAAFRSLDIDAQRSLMKAKLSITCHLSTTHGRGVKRLEITAR